MNTSILMATILVELVLVVCRFISVHLRDQARRRGIKPPIQDWLPFEYDWYWLNMRDPRRNKGLKAPNRRGASVRRSR
jgi:hypothetical protein